jgi:hypothetical protein
MRFQIGSIPETPDFAPDASWRPMREPTPWVMQFLALPIAILVAALTTLLWFTITPLEIPREPLSVPAFLLLFASIVVVHELVHAAVHPKAGRSAYSILGVWPSRLLFYAHYEGELSRNRFVAVLLMPLVVISFVPLLAAAAMQVTSVWAAYISVLNALAACGDVLGVGLILFQVPATAMVRNQAWRTYWREDQETGDEPARSPNDGAGTG